MLLCICETIGHFLLWLDVSMNIHVGFQQL